MFPPDISLVKILPRVKLRQKYKNGKILRKSELDSPLKGTSYYYYKFWERIRKTGPILSINVVGNDRKKWINIIQTRMPL